MAADGMSTHKMKGPLLSMVPFCGSYISVKELKTHIPKDWQGWEPTVASLGRHFLQGLFDSRRGVYPESPFELGKRSTRNRWLADKFAATEKRLLL
jgi:hypothetical protein